MRGDKIDPSVEIIKLVDYVGTMAKQSFNVECMTRQKNYSPPSKILLTPSYFRSDKCQSCGKCCSKTKTLVWTKADWENRVLKADVNHFDMENLPTNYYIQLLQNAKPVTMKVNDNYCDFMVYTQNKGCTLTFVDGEKVRCGIHPIKPLQCGIPLTVFNQMKKSKVTYIRKHSNKRNWRLGCKVILDNFNYNDFEYYDLQWLVLLKDLAEDMGVKSYLPDLLHFFKDVEGHLIRGSIPKRRINFMTLLKQTRLF